ncbi:AlpA family phage regulatory protein [Oxalobacter aliiformigenes]|uniref:helix-turn-helix transcriptional regulator n=1 Tax=Oxalobacter aliiformigenes TaxID=2946593 RepID=UPI0022AFFB43|nr:AlpA family phage regulatory protein [Oxalobacter aliiformigenes]MCZ4065385.1 AlpA family phage regulatory protein [Oxalobacter aliiformigenes]WAV99076.1 AlpA family phage regulatory protein [Oxalobacter aliiformigenes]
MTEINFLNLQEVSSETHQCRSKIYAGMKKGVFPESVRIGSTVVWLESEINEWEKAVISGFSEPEMKVHIAKVMAKRQLAGM